MFRSLEHTADAKYEVVADSLEEAFAECARALFSTLLPIEQVKQTTTRDVAVTAYTKESLLYDFLQELLFLHETDGILVSAVPAISISKESVVIEEERDGAVHEIDRTKYALTATVAGDDYKKYDVHGAVKSMTYSEMEIEKKDDKVRIVFVVDI